MNTLAPMSAAHVSHVTQQLRLSRALAESTRSHMASPHELQHRLPNIWDVLLLEAVSVRTRQSGVR
jgi:hypothetical protein